jgi:hypothetical protein
MVPGSARNWIAVNAVRQSNFNKKQKMKTKNMTTLHVRKSIGPECFRGFLLIPIALCCFALSPAAQAVLPAPPPDGGYPGNNTAEGQNALQNLTSGLNNAGIGFRALFSDTSGSTNTATGAQTLFSNTTGGANTANGYVALTSNTTGASNTAIGSGALHGNTTASHNTATGYISLYNTTTGSFNVADGDRALYTNTTGTQNTATGYQALGSNTTGNGSTAVGYQALFSNTTSGFPPGDGTCNAVGYQALQNNTTGRDNSAIGFRALQNNVIGSYNNAVGWKALVNSTGTSNTAIGDGAGVNVSTANDVLCLGAGVGGADVSGTTWIANVYSVTTQSGTALPVYVSDGGQLGTAASSERFKKDISPMDRSSEAILRLKPVTFHYKTDSRATAQFGLIAEDVEKVNPDLVVRDTEGKVFSVRYDAVNAMLLNEFLKEHCKVQDLEATVAQQHKGMEVLAAQLKEQASQIQKVSAQLELNKPAPRTVLNNQ